MPQTYAYDINAVNLSIAGILIEAGGGDDGWISLDLPQGFDAKSGVHGDVVSYKMGDNVAEGTLTLIDPSPYNEDLFALYQADRFSPSGDGIGAFILEDLNSSMEITGKVRITKPPRVQKQAETQSYEWQFQVFLPRVAYRKRGTTTPTITITFP